MNPPPAWPPAAPPARRGPCKLLLIIGAVLEYAGKATMNTCADGKLTEDGG
jgi:hypothetical protein